MGFTVRRAEDRSIHYNKVGLAAAGGRAAHSTLAEMRPVLENIGFLFTIGTALVILIRWRRSLPETVARIHYENEQFLLRNAVADGTNPRRREAAILRLTREIARRPEDVLSYLLCATVYHTCGKTVEAIDDYSEVLQREPSHVTALMNRASLYGASSQYDAAVADLSCVLDNQPQLGRALLLRAMAHYQAGRRDDAIADLEGTRSLALSDRADSLRRLQLWFELRHDLHECDAEVTRQLDQEPESMPLHYLRGCLRSVAGRTTDARKDFEFVASHADESREAATYRGDAHMRLQRWDDAATEFTFLIESDPEDDAIRERLAQAQLCLGNVDRALAELHELVRRGGASAEALAQRASLQADAGRYHEAIADFRDSLRLDPDCVNALNGLAWLLSTCPSARFRSGHEAVRLATRACERTDWESELTLGTLGTALAECGQFEEAIRREEQAQARMSAKMLARWGFLLDRYRSGEPYRSSPGEYVRELRTTLEEAVLGDG